MVTRQVRVSDISGQEDARQFGFGLSDQWYEIDLIESEQDALEEMVRPYIAVGRQRKSRAWPRSIPVTTFEERREIRGWALENDYEIARFGVIPKHTYEAYQEAHRKDG